MTPEELKEIQGYVANCEPVPLELGELDPKYEPLDEGGVRGDDGSAVDVLTRAFSRRGGGKPACLLFTGFPGSGKTTELYRLKAKLEQNEEIRVVLINFEDYINLYAPISVMDVLRVIAYGLDREASVQEAIAAGTMTDPDKVEVGYLRRFFRFVSETDVDLQNIGFEFYGVRLMFEIKENPKFYDRVKKALDLRLEAFVQEALEAMDSSVNRIKAATRSRDIMVIADGLEKLTHLGEETGAANEAAVHATFVKYAELLRIRCHIIYTFPPWLRFQAPMLGGLYDDEPITLPVIKIADPDGRPFQPGLDKLTRLVGKRVNIERVFGKDVQGTLVPILEASGGYFRDLLRLIRNILVTVPALPATADQCKRAIARLREVYKMSVRTPDVELLVEVAKAHKLPDGDTARLAAFGRLMDTRLVFAYRNGEEWYDLHPLVRELPLIEQRLKSPE